MARDPNQPLVEQDFRRMDQDPIHSEEPKLIWSVRISPIWHDPTGQAQLKIDRITPVRLGPSWGKQSQAT